MKKPSNDGGYALLVVLMALLAAAVMVPVFARSVFARVQTTAKAQRQDLAASELESRYAELRSSLRMAMGQAAIVRFNQKEDADAGIVQTVVRGGNESYELTATSTPSAGSNGEFLATIEVVPWAWGGERGLRSYAGMPDSEAGLEEMLDDPFHGAPAEVFPITINATLTPRIQAVSSSDLVPLNGQLRLAVRRIPASAFTVASMGDVQLDSTTADEGSGRVYARQSLTVSTNALTSAKVVAGRQVNVTGGARLTVSWNGGEMTVLGPMRSDSEDWSATRQTYASGPMPLTTGRETPVSLIQQFPLATYLEPATAAGGGGSEPPAWEAAKFDRYVSLVITDQDGTLSLSGPVANQPGVRDSLMYYVTTRHTTGRIVRIDLASLASAIAGDVLGTVGPKISVVVRSNSNTSVLLVNGESASSDISLATALPVFVAGALNDGAARAVSILTTARVSSVLAEF